MTPPFVPIGGGLSIDTRPQMKLVKKTRKSDAGLISTWVKKRPQGDKTFKKIAVYLSPELYARLMDFKARMEYPTTSALVSRCIESYLIESTKRWKP